MEWVESLDIKILQLVLFKGTGKTDFSTSDKVFREMKMVQATYPFLMGHPEMF